jgi:ABC-2 type transport system ATP-binding protein
MPSPLVQVRALAKSFGNRPALAGVDLEVAAGEVLGLVGPNGAGKSTLLRCLVGIVRPDRGKMRLGGIDPLRRPVEARRRAAYLPGDANLYETMRGEEFLRFCLRGYPGTDGERARRLAERFEVPLQKKIRTYSHGMKRKLALLQALVPVVPVHLLDEPTEGLDPTVRIVLLEELAILRAQGRAIVFSDHGLAQVERICDRVAFLDRGHVLASDTIEGVRARASRSLRVSLRDPASRDRLPGPGVRAVEERDGVFHLRIDGDPRAILERLLRLPLASIEWSRPTLEEIYAEIYAGRLCSPAA